MNSAVNPDIYSTGYAKQDCTIGVVHLGFGAFHRAHQAVYLDDYMQQSGDLNWGIAAVNLRQQETPHFDAAKADITNNDGYYIKSCSADGSVQLRRVRSHVAFADWSTQRQEAENLLALDTVNLVTITVTESGYYVNANGELDCHDPIIAMELAGGMPESVYGFLRVALNKRRSITGKSLTIACCDNIRRNGDMLKTNLLAYLEACGDKLLHCWVMDNVAFPCSMVDRITPRSSAELSVEISTLVDKTVTSPIIAEDYRQWVLQDAFKTSMPDLATVGVTVTPDVDPYEETKIRVLNGGHTSLAYLAALHGIETFDASLRHTGLKHHFDNFENQEVLPAITTSLPFSKADYLCQTTTRFANQAIGDTIARICADGMSKFAIFIRPTLEGCLNQGILPVYAIRSVASWHQFAVKVAAGKIPFEYVEPSWNTLASILGTNEFVTSRQLWGDLPKKYPQFVATLQQEIKEMEQKWPV